jgi:hypothetical protein
MVIDMRGQNNFGDQEYEVKFIKDCLLHGRYYSFKETRSLRDLVARDACRLGLALPCGTLAKLALGSLVPVGTVEPPDPVVPMMGWWVRLHGRPFFDSVQKKSFNPEEADVFIRGDIPLEVMILEEADRDNSRPRHSRPFVEPIGISDEYRLELIERRKALRMRNPVDVKQGRFGCSGLVVGPPPRERVGPRD